MAKTITAPESFEENGELKLFLAGGISNCPDWQSEMIDKLSDTKLNLFNPRRKNFPMDDPDAANEQITWEFNWLKRADVISFWFSEGSMNPIVLYELGMWGNSRKIPIFIGVHPKYERLQDVMIQTSLARPDVVIVNSIKDICTQIKIYIRSQNLVFKK